MQVLKLAEHAHNCGDMQMFVVNSQATLSAFHGGRTFKTVVKSKFLDRTLTDYCVGSVGERACNPIQDGAGAHTCTLSEMLQTLLTKVREIFVFRMYTFTSILAIFSCGRRTISIS